MKRLCFYCFWITEYSRLIRRYVAKEYYALNEAELLSIPFFASNLPSNVTKYEILQKGRFRDRRRPR